MGKVIKIENGPMKVERGELSQILPEKEYLFLQEIIEAFYYENVGGNNHNPDAVKGNIMVIEDLIAFCGKAPWNITENDYNKWCVHLSKERTVTPGTERKYQGIIQKLYEYCVRDQVAQNRVSRLFGKSFRQIVHKENRITHTQVLETKRLRVGITHEEFDFAMIALGEAIKMAALENHKGVFPLMRDKAMFYTAYACGLRASEALGMNTISIFSNPDAPKFGKYGIIHVVGKGSKGSNGKARDVTIENPFLPPILKWYEETVRPYFLSKAKIGEKAYFLSDIGRRLSISSFEARFQNWMEIAGLLDNEFVPHCLRHSSVTHKGMKYSTEAVRRLHGHVFSATTQGYSHIPDEFVRAEIRKNIRKSLEIYNDYMERKNK